MDENCDALEDFIGVKRGVALSCVLDLMGVLCSLLSNIAVYIRDGSQLYNFNIFDITLGLSFSSFALCDRVF